MLLQSGPGFNAGCCLVIMSIRCLKNFVVSPVRSSNIIVVIQLRRVSCYIVLIANASQNSVGDLNDLSAGNCILGTESTVRVAIYPALLCSGGDCCICPVRRRNISESLGATRQLVEAGCNGCILSTGDGSVRTERAIIVALEDACVSQGCNLLSRPAVVCISKARAGSCVLITSVVGEQTIEDSGNFCTSDVSFRMNAAVRITLDVSDVVAGKELSYLNLKSMIFADVLELIGAFGP